MKTKMWGWGRKRARLRRRLEPPRLCKSTRNSCCLLSYTLNPESNFLPLILIMIDSFFYCYFSRHKLPAAAAAYRCTASSMCVYFKPSSWQLVDLLGNSLVLTTCLNEMELSEEDPRRHVARYPHSHRKNLLPQHLRKKYTLPLHPLFRQKVLKNLSRFQLALGKKPCRFKLAKHNETNWRLRNVLGSGDYFNYYCILLSLWVTYPG